MKTEWKAPTTGWKLCTNCGERKHESQFNGKQKCSACRRNKKATKQFYQQYPFKGA